MPLALSISLDFISSARIIVGSKLISMLARTGICLVPGSCGSCCPGLVCLQDENCRIESLLLCENEAKRVIDAFRLR